METQENWKSRFLPMCIIFPLLGLVVGYAFSASEKKRYVGSQMVKASWTWLAVQIGIYFLIYVIGQAVV